MAHAITNNIIILFQGKSKLSGSSFYLIVIRINFKHIIRSFSQHSP